MIRLFQRSRYNSGSFLFSQGGVAVSAHNDSEFMRMFSYVILALAAFGVTVFLLAGQLSGLIAEDKADVPAYKAMQKANIEPVGKVNIVGQPKTVEKAAMEPAPTAMAEAVAAATSEPAAEAGDKGKTVYTTACFACHGTGAANAPKLGDTAAWAPRIAQGEAVLLQNALKGKGAMPPKGGRMDFSDDDIAAAMKYMVSNSK